VIVLQAARAARAGRSKEEVLRLVRSAVHRTALFLILPDLVFLHRAGRLGLAQAWLGKTLDLVPIITVRDGVVHPYRLARGRRAALKAVATAGLARFGTGRSVRAAAVHASAEAEAREVLAMLGSMMAVTEQMVVRAGAAVTAALGPGTVGLCFLADEDEEGSRAV
jgi:DegV family protein with EDD domain